MKLQFTRESKIRFGENTSQGDMKCSLFSQFIITPCCYVGKLNTLQVATHISYEGGTLLGADASDLSLSRFDPQARLHLNMDIETCQSCQCLAMQRCNLAKCST